MLYGRKDFPGFTLYELIISFIIITVIILVIGLLYQIVNKQLIETRRRISEQTKIEMLHLFMHKELNNKRITVEEKELFIYGYRDTSRVFIIEQNLIFEKNDESDTLIKSFTLDFDLNYLSPLNSELILVSDNPDFEIVKILRNSNIIDKSNNRNK